jgi:hypothetical protein
MNGFDAVFKCDQNFRVEADAISKMMPAGLCPESDGQVKGWYNRLRYAMEG